jgi:predicted SprT family Zn-dependent metalloprotease
MGINSIKYKRKTIKIIWEKYEDCFGIFDPSKLTLHINPKLSKKMLGKILFHEIWHVICYLNETNINLIGEEKSALLTEQFAIVLTNNPKLKRLLFRCLV